MACTSLEQQQEHKKQSLGRKEECVQYNQRDRSSQAIEMVGRWEMKQNRKRIVVEPTRVSNYLVVLQDLQEVPSFVAPNSTFLAPLSSLARTSQTFPKNSISVTIIVNAHEILPHPIEDHGLEYEETQEILVETRQWYDGRSSSCEGDSSDRKDQETYMKGRGIEENASWPLELLH